MIITMHRDYVVSIILISVSDITIHFIPICIITHHFHGALDFRLVMDIRTTPRGTVLIHTGIIHRITTTITHTMVMVTDMDIIITTVQDIQAVEAAVFTETIMQIIPTADHITTDVFLTDQVPPDIVQLMQTITPQVQESQDPICHLRTIHDLQVQ
jgi:hypothetical protein